MEVLNYDIPYSVTLSYCAVSFELKVFQKKGIYRNKILHKLAITMN